MFSAASTTNPTPPVWLTGGKVHALGLREVTVRGGFSAQKKRKNVDPIVPQCGRWVEKMGLLANLDAAADCRLPQGRQGRVFSDFEVYKLLEAMSWKIERSADDAMDDRFSAIVTRVSAARDDDGDTNTNFGRPDQAPHYSDLECDHELALSRAPESVRLYRSTDQPQFDHHGGCTWWRGQVTQRSISSLNTHKERNHRV